MPIYSRKYGRTFKNRSELQRHAFWDYRTKPILPWFGARDMLYSDEYKRQHGLIKNYKNPWYVRYAVLYGGCFITANMLIAGIGWPTFWMFVGTVVAYCWVSGEKTETRS